MFHDWTHRFNQCTASVVLARDFSGTSFDRLGALRLVSGVDVYFSSRNARFGFLEESLDGAELQACGEEMTQNLAIGSQFSNNFTQLIVEEEDDEYNDNDDGARMLGTTAIDSSSSMAIRE